MLRMSNRARSRLAAVVAVTLALATTGTLATTTLAHATTQSQLDSEQSKASQLEAQIEANGNRVSVLDEQYNRAQVAIDQATEKIKSDQKAVDAKEAQTRTVRDQLTARGAELYMGADIAAPLAALDVSDSQQLGSRSAYGAAAAEQDRQLLNKVKVAIEELGVQKDALGQARAAAVKQRDQLDQARNEIQRATEEQQSLLSQAKGNIKTLVDQIQAEKAAAEAAAARAAQERAHAEARAQALAAQRQSQSSGSGSSNNSGGSSNGSSFDGASAPSDPNLPAPSAQAQIAVDTAKAQLGKPYVYAGSGPSVFDCSGLTAYAWAAAGVSMSHNAEAQYQSLPHVSQSELAPGDLVFFGSPIHHVGMYVGGGTMIEAPYTGVDVRYHTIYRRDYAGSARP